MLSRFLDQLGGSQGARSARHVDTQIRSSSSFEVLDLI